MARTIAEIKKTMTDAFMADATVREKYGLKEGDTFSGSFSVVSLESILFHIVAACCWALETLLDGHIADVDEKISRAVVASVPWYYKMARAFQYGDALVFDDATQEYKYAAEDEGKQVVKYAAVRDRGTMVDILVSGEKDGRPVPLSGDVLTAFSHYMDREKIAGVVLGVKSQNADSVRISATVYVDPLVLGSDGSRIEGGGKPVEEAIEAYLKGIVYGGTLNKTKLVDAIQAADGVTDVELGDCQYKADGAFAYEAMKGNNYTAEGGSFIAEGLGETISYVVQD